MGIIKEFNILFDNKSQVYEVSGVVSGIVCMTLSKELKLKDIEVWLTGNAKTEWGEKLTRYLDEENLIDLRLDLLHTGDPTAGASHSNLSAGVHVFPFRFELPSSGLPCSFEGRHGYVRYLTKCTVHRFDGSHVSIQNGITILGEHGDTERNPDLQIPMERNAILKFSGCVNSSNITLAVGINRCFHTPGEPIVVKLNLENNSSSKVRCIQMLLMQNVQFTARKGGRGKVRKKTSLRQVKCISSNGCKAHSTTVWQNEYITIPPVPPTALPGCTIINVAYHLWIKAFVGRSGSEFLDVSFPIKVGTLRRIREERSDSAPPYLATHAFTNTAFHCESVNSWNMDLFGFIPYLSPLPAYDELYPDSNPDADSNAN
ncbi:arrestin domain-containing protein 17-like [Glandiceps talaboti]